MSQYYRAPSEVSFFALAPFFAVGLAIAGFVAIFLSNLAMFANVSIAFRGLAGGLLLAALGMMVWRLIERSRARTAVALVGDVIDADPVPYILSDAKFRVVERNRAAQARYDVGDIEGLLSEFFASPESILLQLSRSLQDNDHAQCDTHTNLGVLAILVRRVGPELYLWRIEQLRDSHESVEADTASTKASDQFYFTTAADGAVDTVSPALRELLGKTPDYVHDFIPGGLPKSNSIVTVASAEHRQKFAVHRSDHDSENAHYTLILVNDIEMGQDAAGEWDVLESLPVPLLQLSLSGEITASNRSARSLLRSDVGPGSQLADYLDGLGRPVRDWIEESYAQDARAARSQFLRGVGPARDLFVQVALCPSISGQKSQTIAVLHDMTEFKLLEAQFVQSQKMQGIGQLAGGVAHDFNNLITAINGHCELLLMRHDVNDPDHSDLTQIHQNTNRAAALVSQLLAFRRSLDMRMETVDLRDTLADLTHLLNRLVGEKVRLVLRHYPKRLFFTADKRQFEQVILNLVVNARDAMAKGGQITIETEAHVLTEPLKRDRAQVPEGKYIVVRVRDEGRGIAPELVNQVFEPFYTTKKSGEGTGLGLSTVYGIVKQTGGFVFVDSVVGEGTEFSIYFPERDEAEAKDADTDAGGEVVTLPVAEKKTTPRGCGVILLVEDEAPVRAFASRALKLRGYDVLEADCGEAALERLEEVDHAVDLVVTDVVMPGMDGPSWVSKALETHPNMNVVFMSGYSEESMRKHREQIPGAMFLPKPFALDSLLSVVQEQLG